MGDNLTTEQKQALDELMRLMAEHQPAPVEPPSAPAKPPDGHPRGGQPGDLQNNLASLLPGSMPELMETWLGISRDETNGFVNSLISQKDALQNRFLEWAERNPMDAVFQFLAAASLAFYMAEKEVNPKIKTYFDAFYYISTSASVGYADIFAVTQTGRTIAALVMILGPALTGHALERPAVDSKRSDPFPVSSVKKDRKERPNGNAA